MLRLNASTLRRTLGQFVTVAAIVALTVLAMRVTGPRETHAQPAQQDEVRARAFVLVGPDGTVLGRLAPGPTGNGNLTLFDTAGKQRISIAGAGFVTAFDDNGNARMSLGFSPATGLAFMVFNDVNQRLRLGIGSSQNRSDGFGVTAFDKDGNSRATFGFNADTRSSGLAVLDENQIVRVRAGAPAGGVFGVSVRDAEGNVAAMLP